MALSTNLVINAETAGDARGLGAQFLTPYKLFLLSVPSAVLPWGRGYHNHSFGVRAVPPAGLLCSSARASPAQLSCCAIPARMPAAGRSWPLRLGRAGQIARRAHGRCGTNVLQRKPSIWWRSREAAGCGKRRTDRRGDWGRPMPSSGRRRVPDIIEQHFLIKNLHT
jgi:hypothetical protein